MCIFKKCTGLYFTILFDMDNIYYIVIYFYINLLGSLRLRLTWVMGLMYLYEHFLEILTSSRFKPMDNHRSAGWYKLNINAAV